MLQPIKLYPGVLSFLIVIPSIAHAEIAPVNKISASETTPTKPLERMNSSSQAPNSSTVSQETSGSPAPTCPPGEFASKFSDVTPKDWAYKAVNQIAAGQFRCFPWRSHI